MKYFFYIIFFISMFSCSSDDNQETETPNTLIIKHITDVRENNERNFYFDLNGRLVSITDTNALPEYNYILSEFEYSNDNKLNSSYHTYGTEEAFINLTYTDNNITNYKYVTLGYSIDSNVVINNNTLNYIDLMDSDIEEDDLNIQWTFSSDQLKYLAQKKSTLINNANSVQNLTDYEYDNNFNIVGSHTTISYGIEVDYSNTYTYDDKKNPIAESMDGYNLALYFMDDHNTVAMSPNNVLSKTDNQGNTLAYNYVYNDDDYPMSVTITNVATGEVINTLTYTYY
ncbi:hypothetical protein [Winogradskyella sediminis]|uniref:Uncharacterized protein n=1 Tax=Winogradskyella sediminis TaxID=1382466 RepID=A0A1H1PD05_9FLAO|nr:hypothetical protein [Winogradskyella sediminis]REG90093.1 hypothetical protein C8N41_1011341 [Winogradskyella sediminis]SDS09156.1 hypothetical protein SAMN04489797_0844 [Winogradskyella sediminis]